VALLLKARSYRVVQRLCAAAPSLQHTPPLRCRQSWSRRAPARGGWGRARRGRRRCRTPSPGPPRPRCSRPSGPACPRLPSKGPELRLGGCLLRAVRAQSFSCETAGCNTMNKGVAPKATSMVAGSEHKKLQSGPKLGLRGCQLCAMSTAACQTQTAWPKEGKK